MNQTIRQAARLEGAVALPADKSIAHRAALLAALSDGPSKITNFPNAADPRSTLACLRQLGVEIDEEIPAEHFKAVAEIIGYVFRLKGKMGAH